MVPGIGDILAMTILLEVGDISRFARVGDFTSYCRCVPTGRFPTGRQGKRQCEEWEPVSGLGIHRGGIYLTQAVPKIAGYYKRKASKTHRMVAIKTIASKLARACYYMLRDGVEFKEEMLFC